MSRIGKQPVALPKGVSANWAAPVLTVKGPKGELRVEIKPPIGVTVEKDLLKLTRPDDERLSKSAQGLYRSLVNNAVHGVSQGYEKRLEVVGVGYKAEVTGQALKLSLGFAGPKLYPIPAGLTIKTEKDAILISGASKQAVGNAAAEIRHYRPPEPYKGKGVRYSGEQIKRKAGKAAVGAGGGKK